MKAVVLEAQQRMVYQDLPRPEPAADEVLLEVKAVSICGSDVKRYISGHHTYPMVLGHECAGVVVEVGADVDPALVGEHAALIPLVPCMTCPQCRRGLYSACPQYRFIGSRGWYGGFAEYVAAPARGIIPVPRDVPFEAAALIEPSTVALHAMDIGRFAKGQSVAVLGAGNIGLMAIQWARILGASHIISIDVQDDKLQYATKFGATTVLNPQRDDVRARVLELTGDGVDLAHEMAGVPQTFETALAITRPRGSIVLTGNQPKDATFPARLLEDITRKEVGVFGTWMSYSAPFPGHEWDDSIAAFLNGSLNTADLISHRFPLSATEQVFEQIRQGQLAYRKIMLLPGMDQGVRC